MYPLIFDFSAPQRCVDFIMPLPQIAGDS